MGETSVYECALPGCTVMIEQVPGKPARRYCSAAHRAAGRRLRGGVDDPGADYASAGSEQPVAAAVRPGSASGSASQQHAEPARPRPAAASSGNGAANGQGHSGPSAPAPAPWSQETPTPPPAPAPRAAQSQPQVDPFAPIAHRGPEPGPAPVAQPSSYGFAGNASDLTDDMLVRSRVERPQQGWRGAVFAASGGRMNPGVSEAEAARNALLRRIRRHLPGAHQIAVSSLKGGVGKTTVSAVLGLTLAEHRGDRVVAVDANPDAGTLADRLTGEIGITVRQMLDNIDSIDSLTAVSHYTSLAGRLQVLASEQDPAMSEAFNRGEYEQICAVLARFYNIIITDSGTGLVHSAMEGTLALADSLVVVGAPTVDGASRASKTLDWLVAHGYAEQVADAIVVLCCDRVSPEIDRERVRAHFLARSRAVVEIPYDPHLATGGRLDLAAMREPTKLAFLELGALIADEFSA